jgi:uncharacterized protein with NRDE domain
MCTLAIFRDVSERYPLVIAANRDEFLERPSLSPAPLAEDAGIVAGRDLRAGGTWLGCRVDGAFLAAGLLNRRAATQNAAARSSPRTPPVTNAPVSRGALCLAALAHRSVAGALSELRERQLADFDPFNLLLVDRDRGVVVDNRDGCHETELRSGLSVLTNLDVNAPRCPRLASAHAGFERVAPVLVAGLAEAEIVEALAEVLRDHAGSADASGADPFARVCVHADGYGTRSSSIVLLRRDGAVAYFHADEAPCRAPFRRVTPPASTEPRP